MELINIKHPKRVQTLINCARSIANRKKSKDYQIQLSKYISIQNIEVYNIKTHQWQNIQQQRIMKKEFIISPRNTKQFKNQLILAILINYKTIVSKMFNNYHIQNYKMIMKIRI